VTAAELGARGGEMGTVRCREAWWRQRSWICSFGGFWAADRWRQIWETAQGMPSAASRLGGAGFDGEVMMRRRDYVAGGLGRSLHRRGLWR
jgi:hypothetical protein